MADSFIESAFQSNSTGARIVGGFLVRNGEAPWIVSLQYRNRHYGGGSIVSKSAILTAGHCVHNRNLQLLKIQIGSIYLYRDGTLMEVSKVLKHPQYSWIHNSNDIAIIYLKQPIIFQSADIAPIELPNSSNLLKIGTLVSIFGWGYTREHSVNSLQLQTVDVPIVSQRDCKYAYKELIQDSMFCAGYFIGRRDACQGDSGGPLVLGQTLVGIVSFGDGCARPARFGVYTKVHLFTNWIRQSIAE